MQLHTRMPKACATALYRILQQSGVLGIRARSSRSGVINCGAVLPFTRAGGQDDRS